MNKAELIRHEIEKRRDHNLAIGNPLFSAMAEEDIELLCFIDSLQEEPVSEELEEAARKQLMADIWHKESEHPDNRHPYPVLNPDGEMAYAYYDELCGWQFDRDFKHSVNMLWLDIEKILPKKD